jgi:hypothetical protein
VIVKLATYLPPFTNKATSATRDGRAHFHSSMALQTPIMMDSSLAMDIEMNSEPMGGTKTGGDSSEMDCEATMGVNQQLQQAKEVEEEEETTSSTTTNNEVMPTQEEERRNGPSSSRRERRKKRIEFSETVRVVLIPSHTDYAADEKEAMWASKKAIAAMASNNFIEFAAEGWDWRNAVDDDDMIQVPAGSADGIVGAVSKMHPIHSNPYLKDALIRGIPYPMARAVTPPGGAEGDITMMSTSGDDNNNNNNNGDDDDSGGGAISFDGLPYEIERPASPFLHPSEDDDDEENDSISDKDDNDDDDDDDDDVLLDIDPDEYLRRRMSCNLRARTSHHLHHHPYDDDGGVGCWLQEL